MNMMNHLEKLILRILERHRGRNDPVTCRQLEKITGSSSRNIRKTIANLVIRHHIPVASSVCHPYGFFLITNKQEAETCLRQYYSRVRGVVNRARILNEVVKEKFGISYQEEFDFVRKRKPST